MKVLIFGREGCKFCSNAKALASECKEKLDDFDYTYVDVNEQGLSKEDIINMCGPEANTLPQIFVDERHIGGFVQFDGLNLLKEFDSDNNESL